MKCEPKRNKTTHMVTAKNNESNIFLDHKNNDLEYHPTHTTATPGYWMSFRDERKGQVEKNISGTSFTKREKKLGDLNK